MTKPSLAQDPIMAQVNGQGNGKANGTSDTGDSRLSRHRSVLSMSFGDLTRSARLGVPKRPAEVSQLLEDKVRQWGGDRPVHSVLVANNGLAAVKFMRSVRTWAYKCFGDERAVNLIAMATPDDMKADAEHVRMADQFVEVPGGGNANNYANVQLITSVAVRTGVDAVWPGWGHASEKPDLPDSLDETPTRIRFIGPPSHAMAALGDKIGSTILAQSAGVPTLPWSGDGVTISYDECENGELPAEIYDKACIHSLAEALETCRRIGYPIMLKASWGGGGKGIRKVMSDEDVKLVYKQVKGEVPGSPVFAMKLAPQSRHLEVQLLADMHGNVCSLFSRDCSVQRRHQKIVEEGPVTAAPPHVLNDMEKCARALARSVGYVGAATVEYLYALESGEYCFLELNPRLQVEHPVTEWISGVNIPSCQLLIAQGVPLHRIPDIRRLYGLDPEGIEPIDFENVAARSPAQGHVVAVRITAENANAGFKPTCGGVDEISFRSTPDVWGYFSVKGGGAIHEFSDSQFGHLFARGDNREAAIRSMVVALKEIKIRGEIRTNADYVCDLIQVPDFVNNLHHTGWLDARIAAQITSGRPPWHLSAICGTVLRATERHNSFLAEYLGYLQKGQLPPARVSIMSSVEEFVVDGTKYKVKAVRTGPSSLRLHLGTNSVDVEVRKLNDGGLLIQVDGASHVVHSEEEAVGTRLAINNFTCLLSNEHDPSKMLAMSTGKLVRYLVEDGSKVKADEPYAEVEVMKMMMTLLTPAAGVVHFQLPEGSVLVPGQLIARLDLENPAAVRRAELFTGSWPELGPPAASSDNVAHRFASAFTAAKNILAGYQDDVDKVVARLLSALDDEALGLLQWNDAYSAVGSRLPANLAAALETIASDCAYDIEQAILAGVPGAATFVAPQLVECMETELETCTDAGERTALAGLLAPLLEVTKAHAGGKQSYARLIATDLMESYLEIEEKFESEGKATEQEVIDGLRQTHSTSLQDVFDIVIAHNGAVLKGLLLQRIMAALVLPSPEHYRPQLRRLAALSEQANVEVAQRAQQLLEHSLLGELRALVARALSGLDMFAASQAKALFGDANNPLGSPVREATLAAQLGQRSGSRDMRRPTVIEGLYAGLGNVASPTMQSAGTEERMAMLVEAPAAVEDALASLLDHSDPVVQRRALVTYIKRIYHPHLLHEPEVSEAPGNILVAVWAYDDPFLAGTAFSKECNGGAVLVPSLRAVPEALTYLERAREQLGFTDLHPGTLHIALTQQGDLSLALTPEAYDLLTPISADDYAPSESEDFRTGPEPTRIATAAAAQVSAIASKLAGAGFAAVSVLSQRGKLAPMRTVFYRQPGSPTAFTMRRALGWIEPPMAAALELEKLTEFSNSTYAASRNRQWHVYTITERKNAHSLALKRVFLRGVVRQLGRPDLLAATYSQNAAAAARAGMEEVEQTLAGALTELIRIGNTQLAATGSTAVRPDWAHIYLTVLSSLPLHEEKDESRVAAALKAVAGSISVKHSVSLRKAAVAQWEVRLPVPGKSSAWRVVVSAPTGHESGEECVEVYREAYNSEGQVCYTHAGGSDCVKGAMDWQPVLQPYGPLEPLQQKRLAARRHKTTYCYDFPAVFENALREIWATRAAAGEPNAVPPSGKLVEAQELAPKPGHELSFRTHTPLVPVSRPVSENSVGVVAWLLTLKTPECPQGRHAVAIANDITYSSGAFGPAEDAMFRAATEYALEERLPVIYLAANSGARVGLATEVKQCLKVEWINPEDPNKGFKYLYLSNEDYVSITERAAAAGVTALEATLIHTTESNTANTTEERYMITDVVGLEDGLGVECLSGSGAIAGVYSRAFREGFTITMVSGRTVGIGAYLARLGRRCVQRIDQPIILTGYAALNKLLGREVYTSHMQLGGPRVMGANGVSHHVVEDDLEGVLRVLTWLSYTAARVGESPPRLPAADPVDREVEYMPGENEKLDPRAAIAGRLVEVPSKFRRYSNGNNSGSNYQTTWQSGLFDQGSWMEAQAGWARTVVTGRARLGGIPIGVIAVEVNTVTLNLPADPGMPDSSERLVPQAGQVWFPDSALKTAQAMEEFDLEGLPLFVLANWRGFSGGQRDLFEGVLQAGSLIVDALRSYKHPVTVYLPPGCELRGGAWVVIDSQINSERVEMYADPSAQGGVLEPQGVVEIKFRHADLISTMQRIDPVILKLKSEGGGDAAIKAREKQLLPVYHQVALQFAQMHDGPVRMLNKGVLRGIIPWAQARTFFSTRLRRRLAEESLVKHVAAADTTIDREHALGLLRSWFVSSPQQITSGSTPTTPSKNCTAFNNPNNTDTNSTNTIVLRDEESPSGGTGIDWADDSAFMCWAEGPSGAARIAMELKVLRTRAAARLVHELSATQEGTEGLIRGLHEAAKKNPSLMLQLRSTLATK